MNPGVSFFTSAAARDHYLAAYSAARTQTPPARESIDVPTRAGTVRTYRHGSAAGTPVLLLHAMSSTSAGWAPVVGPLSERHTVWTLDAIGQGGASTQTAAIRTASGQVSWLVDLLDELHLDQVHVVGWSHGGWTAFHCARLRPERFVSLTLVEPANVLATFSIGFWWRLLAMPVVSWLPSRYLASVAAEYSQWMLTHPDRRDEDFTNRLGPVLDLLHLGNTTRDYLPLGMPIPWYPRARRLAELRVPVQAVLGGISNVHDSTKAARRLIRYVPTARVHTVTNAGHAPNLESPAEVNRCITDFIAEYHSQRGH